MISFTMNILGASSVWVVLCVFSCQVEGQQTWPPMSGPWTSEVQRFPAAVFRQIPVAILDDVLCHLLDPSGAVSDLTLIRIMKQQGYELSTVRKLYALVRSLKVQNLKERLVSLGESVHEELSSEGRRVFCNLMQHMPHDFSSCGFSHLTRLLGNDCSADLTTVPTTFSDTTFSDTSFADSSFSDTSFADSSFSPENTTPIDTFSDTTSEDASFADSSFSPENTTPIDTFSDTTFSDTSFADSSFSPENTTPIDTFSDTTSEDSSFADSSFSPENTTPIDTFSDSTFADTTFSDTTFSDTTFSDTTFEDTTFEDTTFEDTTFSDTTAEATTEAPTTTSISCKDAIMISTVAFIVRIMGGIEAQGVQSPEDVCPAA